MKAKIFFLNMNITGQPSKEWNMMTISEYQTKTTSKIPIHNITFPKDAILNNPLNRYL